MKYTLECTLEDDGRWLAEVPQLYDVFVYSESKIDAMAKAQALALRMLAEQLEAGTYAPCEISMSIVDRSLEVEGAEIVPSPPADQAAYDAWLIAEVQEALDDDSPSMSTEEAMQFVRASVFGK
jgi:predicted RNase H-like HicB family nuclease